MDDYIAHQLVNGDSQHQHHAVADAVPHVTVNEVDSDYEPGSPSQSQPQLLTSSIIDDYDLHESDEEDYKRAALHSQARQSIGFNDLSQSPSMPLSQSLAHGVEDAMAVIASLSRKSVDYASSLSLTSLTQHLPSSLPPSLSQSQSPSVPPSVNINHRTVCQWTSPSTGITHTVLVVATSTEIFVFEIEPHTVTHQPNLALLSRYVEPSLANIGHVALLPSPSPSQTQSITDIRFAVSSQSDSSASFPSSAVKVYSVRHHRFVHVMRHRSRVHDLIVGARHLAVMLESEIVVYDSAFQSVATLRCANNPADYGVGALGPRLIAYPSAVNDSNSDSPVLIATSSSPTISANNFAPLPPPASQSMTSKASALTSQLHSFTSSVSSEGLSAVTRDIASSLYNIGESGRKAVSAYLTPLPVNDANGSETSGSASVTISGSSGASHSNQLSAASHSPPSPGLSSTNASNGGLVMIRDLTSQRAVCHLKAHSSPIAALAFNPSGTLLVTAGRHGQYIHVYEIIPQPSPSLTAANASTGRAVFLYRLFRGITHAVIRQISFTCDSRWVACTSVNGTVHLFAINAYGGAVSVETHTGKPPSVASAPSTDDHALPLTIPSIHRVRPRVALCSFVRVGSSLDALDHLLLLTEDGECLIFDCKAVARSDGDNEAESVTEIGGPGTMAAVINTAMHGVHSIVNNVVEHAVKAAKAYTSGQSMTSQQHRQSVSEISGSDTKQLALQLTPVYHHSLQQQITMNESADTTAATSDRFLALAAAPLSSAASSASTPSHWASHAELATFDPEVSGHQPFLTRTNFTMITAKDNGDGNGAGGSDWFDEHQRYLPPSSTAAAQSPSANGVTSPFNHTSSLSGYCEVRLEESAVEDGAADGLDGALTPL